MAGDAAFYLMTIDSLTGIGNVAQIISPPNVAGVKQGEGVLSAPDVPCWPLDYLQVQTIQRLGIEAPAKKRQTVIEGQVTIPPGSYLLMNGQPKRYPVYTSEPWDWPGAAGLFTMIVVEAVQA